ncbi:MAG: OmpA family protein [Odoribacter sp.]|nr:OmpA family protein [Odoribacter sp.]
MKHLIILCGVVSLLFACSARHYMRKGETIYNTGRYYKASTRFEKAYDKTKSRTVQAGAAIRAGQACEMVGRTKDAYNWYRKAERADKEIPEIYLKIARVALLMDDEETAREYFEKYEEKYEDGKGTDGIYHLEQLHKDRSEEGRYLLAAKKEFNSRNSDFAPVYAGKDTSVVFFASTRSVDARKSKAQTDPITGEGYSHIYRSEYVQEIRTIDKKGAVKVKKFKEPRWLQPVLLRDSLYSNRSEGAMCLNNENTMYFTSARTLKGGNLGTRIYVATQTTGEEEEEGKEKKGWNRVALAGICGDTVSIGHPALTPDGNRLYFATDALPGGFGGKDIWYVERTDGKWGEPVNAGELVNTPGHEMFPYVRDNGELYFASDGHYGFGGLDLFKITEEDGTPRRQHLPAPLNSFADDFGIVFKPGEEEGLLTSRRTGRGDRIFAFKFIPQQLRVNLLVENAVTELPVDRVNITVTADDGEVTYLETDSLGRTSMAIASDKEYVFMAEHPRFLKGKDIISTYREKADRLYELKLSLQPIEKPIVIPNIYFDVAKWDLRPDAMENLAELLAVLKDNPNITIELSAHTDMVGNDEANMILSENRAQAVVDYLIEKGVYWDRLEAKGYGETQPRQINEKDVREYPFLQVGDVLNERYVGRLRGEQREVAMQLNRRIEFKVLRTNYKPGPNSLRNPNQKAVSAEEGVEAIGKTRLKSLKSVAGNFYTLQLGVCKNVPLVIDRFPVVFTEKLDDGAVRYCVGVYDLQEDAVNAANDLKKKGIECIIKEIKQ